MVFRQARPRPRSRSGWRWRGRRRPPAAWSRSWIADQELPSASGVDRSQCRCFELSMSENWGADARVGVPMMQVIAKQVSKASGRPREVRRIIDQQWLDEESKQQLREIYHVTDADLAVHGRKAASEARRRTR